MVLLVIEKLSKFKRLKRNPPLVGAFILTFALQMATIYVLFLNPIFKTEPLTLSELAITLALSTVVFFAVEAEKIWERKKWKG
jgi:Ca2+-transporting ATPase